MNPEDKLGRVACEKLLHFMEIAYPYVPPEQKLHKKIDPRKILDFADPHEPYSCEKVYQDALQSHHDARRVIVAGDLGDYYSKSRFIKTRNVSFVKELRSVFFRMEWLSTHFQEVEIMVGNHDNRAEKKLQVLLGENSDLLALIQPNLISELASFFPNIKIVGIELKLLGIDEYVPKLVSHIHQVGDIIFTHAERSNIVSDTLLKNISIYLHKWKNYLGLRPYRVIVQAHNHQDKKMTEGTEKWFLTPCVMESKSIGAEYILAPKMYGSPPAVGYAVFYQDNGVTDYNNSGNVLI